MKRNNSIWWGVPKSDCLRWLLCLHSACADSNLSFSRRLVFTMTSSSKKLRNNQQQDIWPTAKRFLEVPSLNRLWHFYRHLTRLRSQRKNIWSVQCCLHKYKLKTNYYKNMPIQKEMENKYRDNTMTAVSIFQLLEVTVSHSVATVIITIVLDKMDVNVGRLSIMTTTCV